MSRAPLRITLVAVALTGACGLGYEVLWQRYLANLLGGQARSQSMILAVFLASLGAGYALFGRLSRGRSPRSLVTICALAEIGIGAWALAFPILYGWLWERVGVLPMTGLSSRMLELLLAVALVATPAILMGSTLPALTQAFARDDRDVSVVHAWIYGSNTFGACLGSFAVGLWLLPSWGLPLAMMDLALANVAAGVVILGVSSRLDGAPAGPPAAPSTIAPAPAPRTARSRATWFALASASGFMGLAFQVLLIRVAGLGLGSSEHAFAMVIGIYLLIFAAGVATVRAPRSPASAFGSMALNQAAIGLGLLLFYAAAPSLPYLVLLVRGGFGFSELSFHLFYGAATLLIGALALLPLLAMGRTQPLLVRLAGPLRPESGRAVGSLYAFNAVGCVLGALAGYELLRWLDLDGVMRMLIAICGATVALARADRVGALTAVALIACALGAPGWDPARLGLGLFRLQQVPDSLRAGHAQAIESLLPGYRVIAHRDDPDATVVVAEWPDRSRGPTSLVRGIWINGKSDGATAGPDLETTRALAHLPILLGEGMPSRVAVVGFGTGVTAGALALHPAIRQIDVIEISSAVRELSPSFDFVNHAVTADPRFRWVEGDAYRFLASGVERYDLIVSEPSNPWMAGVDRLYSQEFFKLAAAGLRENGLFAQWFHTYSASPETFAMVWRTFASAFAHARLFVIPPGEDVILVGSSHPIELDERRLDDRLDALGPPARQEVEAIGMSKATRIIGLNVHVGERAIEDAALHTLEFPKLGYAGTRDLFADRRFRFSVPPAEAKPAVPQAP